LQKVLDYHGTGQTIPTKTFVVTFDDVYENVYHNAFPVLREYGIPATVFLATSYIDSLQPFPFDDWPHKGSPDTPPETWKPITTAQCQEMLASGLIELGTHTHTHADFSGRPDDFRRDLSISLDELRSRFGVTEAHLALPFGNGCRLDDGPELSVAAKQCGVRCILTTESELVRREDDPMNWGRFAALRTDSTAALVAKLDGRYSMARNAWRRWRRWTDSIRHPNSKETARPSSRPANGAIQTIA
jgi:peptidoglycan/xylan/chitin deacetylase (PgdA/CDA1 family)